MLRAIRERLEGVLIAASSAIKAPFYLARLRKLRLICFCFFIFFLVPPPFLHDDDDGDDDEASVRKKANGE